MSLKEKIIKELEKKWFPDLEFLFSDEVLKIVPDLLLELLKKEEEEFEKLLEEKIENITFDKLREGDEKLDYLFSLIWHLDSVNKSDVTEKIIEDFEPKLVEFWNKQAYSEKLYKMYLYVRDNEKLDKEQKRIIDKTIKSFERNWIALEKEKQEQLKEINKSLSKLSNDFSNNIVKDEAEYELGITDKESVKDLPKDVLDWARKLAEEKDIDWYIFTADPTGYIAIMEYCTDSDIRKKFSIDWNKFASSWKFDNREIVLEILKLKDRKAKILWFKNFAELSIDSKMAESPEQVLDLIWWISDKARKKWLLDLEEIKNYYNLDSIEAHDVAFYSRKLKEDKYDLDEKELKKYFEYEKVLEYLFNHVQSFYWIDLKELDINIYSDDVRIFEVIKDWKLISYYFIDPFYRKEKKSWAWANNLRAKDLDKWFLPVVLNVCNFLKSENGKNLISMRDAETLFHEFWHALHEILSESKYSELSWFHVEWDFVELPSQINENWVNSEESLRKLAIHSESWEYISDELIEKLEKLKTFNSGIQTLRQNEFALMDMMLYSNDIPNNVSELDTKILDFINNIWLFKRDESYKMYCSFGHIFWWGYSAGYYSYMWAELLEADVFERIKQMWMFDSKTWEKFVKTILWQGTRKPANELFRDFMWRDLDNTAFMKRKGLGK